ncbi:hypothetical protein FOZ62_002884 [Perkinsus olseni]|uniref:Uncharacterized protein n=1 Tax=Perkinsus olseni TaxID=32597 RepID=A0A7J6R6N2_PEROL|nr:hypothetical protein FOZ62_002884 [Perkinsus olseni]
MENNTSAESRRGALVKATNGVMGEEPIDDVTTFRGRIARDGRARAVEEALRTSSPQVSMRAVLSGIGLEKYFPYFRESGFDLIEANQRQTSREVEDIINTVSKQQRVHIPHEHRAKIWKALRYRWFKSPYHVKNHIHKNEARDALSGARQWLG